MHYNQPRWQVFPSVDDLVTQACGTIAECAAQAIAERGRFTLVLAGGTTPRAVYQRLRQLDTDWSKWHIYYGDERCLPPEHAERNSRMAEQAWLDYVAIPREQIHPIPAELGPEDAAAAYSTVLQAEGEFDLVLLGLGEDAHTASLFPGNVLELAGAPAIPVRGAPKPPAERVSLSASRLSAARRVIFLVTGAGKRQAVQAWRQGMEVPVAAITPAAGAEVMLDATCA